MSTRIYNGFEFGVGNLETVLSLLKGLKKELHQLASRRYSSTVLELAVDLVDKVHIDGSKVTSNAFYRAESEVRDRQKEIRVTGYRDPQVDWDFVVSVFPLRYSKGARVLGIYATEEDEFSKLLKRQSWFIEYGYWNNTDRNDGVSSSAWEKRRRDWDRAMPSGVPADDGFSFDLVSNDRIRRGVDKEDLMPLQPSIERRAKRIAQDLLWREYSAVNVKKDAESHELIRSMMDFEREVLAEGGPRRGEFEFVVKTWIPKLTTLTWEDLKGTE